MYEEDGGPAGNGSACVCAFRACALWGSGALFWKKIPAGRPGSLWRQPRCACTARLYQHPVRRPCWLRRGGGLPRRSFPCSLLHLARGADGPVVVIDQAGKTVESSANPPARPPALDSSICLSTQRTPHTAQHPSNDNHAYHRRRHDRLPPRLRWRLRGPDPPLHSP